MKKTIMTSIVGLLIVLGLVGNIGVDQRGLHAESIVTTNTKTKAETKAKKKITMEATAYTANCTGCSGITRTGINLKANPNQKVIAVDPNVIPLGTRVYVEGYGTAIAGDTGGAIKGNRIDIFIPSRQDALNFGRRQVTVTVLG